MATPCIINLAELSEYYPDVDATVLQILVNSLLRHMRLQDDLVGLIQDLRLNTVWLDDVLPPTLDVDAVALEIAKVLRDQLSDVGLTYRDDLQSLKIALWVEPCCPLIISKT